MKTSTITWAIIILILAGVGGYFLMKSPVDTPTTTPNQETTPTSVQPQSDTQPNGGQAVNLYKGGTQAIIGKSFDGRDIVANYYGNGEKKILFVGGIHGGYSWNTSLVAYELMDYLKTNSTVIPSGVQVAVIPVLNPDGLSKVVATAGRFKATDIVASQNTQISGRFNGNEVDINRNFDCEWKAAGTWQNKTVSGGSEPFSEPESQAIKTFVESYKPDAVVVWYSAAGGVFASSCRNGVSPETNMLTDLYAEASGYPAYQEFDFYEITGDMVNWLAKNNIPGISVLLTNHTDTEWSKNLAGIKALLKHYAN